MGQSAGTLAMATFSGGSNWSGGSTMPSPNSAAQM
jgi:hypothetical protein